MNGTSQTPGVSRRQFVTAGMFAAVGFAWSGCSTDSNGTGESGDNASAAAGTPRILQIGQSGEPPSTLDPARRQPEAVAYDPLIQAMPDGSLEPRLATSWQYIGDDNTTFEIVLRPDVVFSDGTPLNAEAVKTNIEYQLDPTVGSQAQQYLAAVSDIEVVDELTVRVHLSGPNPMLPQVFASHHYWAGYMASPAAIADPDALATGTFGAGQYVLDPDETVHGDHYTYIPNPTYWNPEAVHWDKIVQTFRPDENTTLAALQTGQADAAVASYAIAAAGIEAGLAAIGPGTPIVLGLSLWDRGGELSPPLGDMRVRQALNYAIDRQKITTALVGEVGIPTDQLSAPNQDGWNDQGHYTYDPAKAEQLLTEAGYADGFTISVRTHREEFLDRVVLAIGDELRQIGVELDVTGETEYDQADDEANRKFAAGLIGWGVFPAYLMGRSFWLPDATNNPFESADQVLVDLDREATVADQAARADLDRQIIGRVAELGWFLPVFMFGQSVLYHDDVVEIPAVEPGQDLPHIDQYRPAGG